MRAYVHAVQVRNVFHSAVACLEPTATLAAAARLMHTGKFGSVVIYEGDRLSGIVTRPTSFGPWQKDETRRLRRSPSS